MKLKHLAAVVAMATLALAGCDNKAAETKVDLKTPVQKVSYGIGLTMGKNLKEDGLDDIDPQLLAVGITDGLAGAEQRLADEELMEAFLFVQQRAEERMNALNDAIAKEGRAFLEENAKREGVTTTKSGLQYEVLSATDGVKPKASDTVTVHYTGTLIDGSVFDSSVERGEPVEFPVMAVIPGWVEGLQLMGVGEKYKFFIPSELAYGAQSPSPAIPANSTLLFEVELLDIAGLEAPVAEQAEEGAAEAEAETEQAPEQANQE